MPELLLAFDRSSRTIDADGRLHVAVSNISKAVVSPYYGREIPGYKELGLDADKIYQLLRDPDELLKGADSFNNLPLLDRHIPVSADDPKKQNVVGSTGTDAEFVKPFLRNSLVVWDAAAIAGIESGEQTELSCAYYYKPDMTPGEYEGVQYDGIMRDIVANHVALVELGRCGRDVVVSDADPFDPSLTENKPMTREELLAAVQKLAQDAAIDQKELAKMLAGDADPDKDEQAEDEDEDEQACDEDEDDKEQAQDSAIAIDAAIAKAKTEATNDTIKRMNAIRQAEKDVQPIIGEVTAMDSAEAIYKLAIDHLGIDVTDVHPSAYPALIKMHKAKAEKPKMAHDAAAASDFATLFPTAVKLKSI
jgi:hypothetical protein